MDRPEAAAGRTLLASPGFVLGAGVGMLALATTYDVLLTRVTTLHRTLASASEHPVYLVGLAVLAPLTLGLFGLNAGLFVALRRSPGAVRRSTGTLSGSLVGAFAAGCPSCGAFLLSAVGVSSGLAVLPFGGLELWAAASGLMAITAWRSRRLLRTACAVGSCPTWRPVSYRVIGALSAIALALVVVLATLLVHAEPW